VVNDGDRVQDNTLIARDGEEDKIFAGLDGVLYWEEGPKGRKLATVRHEETEVVEYDIAPSARLRVERGQTVTSGEQLTEGSKNPKEILRILGRDAVQLYLLEEVQRVYRSQGVNINDKHIEIIIRQMVRKVRVREPGQTDFLPGELIDRFAFESLNQTAMDDRKRPAQGQPVLLGITKAALNTESFRAAAPFQETTRVLTEAAVRGSYDELRGLKENVIIGKLIPVGTGFKPERAKRRTRFWGTAALDTGGDFDAEISMGDDEQDEDEGDDDFDYREDSLEELTDDER